MATFLQTDFAEGAKASRDAMLAPIQTEEGIKQLPLVTQKLQAEVSRIPMETQRLQQALEKGQLDMQKERIQTEGETLKLAELVKGIAEDTSAKEVIKNYSSDPTKAALPPSRQLGDMARLMGTNGNLRAFKELNVAADQAAEREERALKMKGERQERDLEALYQVGSFMTPDNIDTYIQMLRTAGIPEGQINGVMTTARQAAAADARDGGTSNFDKFKKLTMDTYGSFAGKAQRAKIAADAAKDRRAEQKLDIIEQNNDLRFSRMAASIQNGLDRQTATNANRLIQEGLSQQRTAESVISRASSNLQKWERVWEEANPRPSSSAWSYESKLRDWKKKRVEELESDSEYVEAKKSIERSKEKLEEAKAIIDRGNDMMPEGARPKRTAVEAKPSEKNIPLVRRGTKESPIPMSTNPKIEDMRDGEYYVGTPKGETIPVVGKWNARTKTMERQ